MRSHLGFSLLVLVFVGCAQASGEVGGPTFDPVDPVAGSEGPPGPSGQDELAAETGGAAGAVGQGGAAGSPLDQSGGAAGAIDESGGGAAGISGGGSAAGAPGGGGGVSTTSCSAGEACCATGPACSGNAGKAKCCADCTGYPGFKCSCGFDYQSGGECKLCCIVCSDGTKRPPEYVGVNETCDGVAKQICATKGGANLTKTGWKASCS